MVKELQEVKREKKFTVIGVNDYEYKNGGNIEVWAEDVSDSYHTMSELYDHRRALNAAFFNLITLINRDFICKSKFHEDGTMFDGYFVVTLNQPKVGQISYHYSLEHWDEFKIPEVERIPWKYDGHTSQDVIERLLKL